MVDKLWYINQQNIKKFESHEMADGSQKLNIDLKWLVTQIKVVFGH